MSKLRVIIVGKKAKYAVIITAAAFFLLSSFILIEYFHTPVNTSNNSENEVIVVDPGHGGIDGGATAGNISEKDINLEISRKLKTYLEEKGYSVILTREKDMSLDHLSDKGQNRHQRDLYARVGIINNSGARLFLSIHANCFAVDPAADGSIVFYSNRFSQNRTLAYCIQRALNNVTVDGEKRTIHDPREASYFILDLSNMPGVIIETAFLSNYREKDLLMKDEFREAIARAIANGVEQYLNH